MFRIATEPFVFLAFMSFGVYTSIVPQLIVSKACHNIYDETICNGLSTGVHKTEEKRVYAEATKWNSICFGAICVPSLLSILVVGALSDVVSKKKLLLMPPVILAIQAVMLMLSAKFMASSLVFVAIAAFLTSLYADIQGFIMVSYSYMADVTEPNQTRTIRMTILGGMVYVSLGFSSFLAGVLLEYYGYVVALSLSLAASVANFSFVAFILPETGRPTGTCISFINKETNTSWRSKLTSFSKYFSAACLNIIRFLKKYLFSWKNKHVALLLLSGLFTNSVPPGESVIMVLFLKHRPLALSAERVGEFLLFQQCIRGVGVTILAVLSLKTVKLSDASIIVIGQISVMATCVAIGLCKEWQMLLAVTPLAIGFSLPSSGIRCLLTKMVEPHEHGTALSCVAFFSIVTWVVMSFGCNELFRLTATVFPGFSVILLAILCFVGFLLALSAFYTKRNHERNSKHVLLPDVEEYETIA